MKDLLIKVFFILIIGLLYSGCYTTLLVPDGDYDSEDVLSKQKENYYQINDYGDYYYYYNRPWWYSAIQDSQNINEEVNDSGEIDSGNGEFIRSCRTVTELPTSPLPTISTSAPFSSASTRSNFSKNKSADRIESVSSSRNENNSNNNNHVRNNDGNRNTSGR
jgi:hypothetical protein